MSNDLDVYHALPVQKFRDTYNKCLNIYHALEIIILEEEI